MFSPHTEKWRRVVRRQLSLAVILVLGACAHTSTKPGEETCGVRDPIACAVQCDEGVESACSRLKDLEPSLLEPDRTVSVATLQGACDEGHPKACARRAVHLLREGKPAEAYALAEPHCRAEEWYPCDVAADAIAAIPLDSTHPFSAAKGAELAADAFLEKSEKTFSYPRTAYEEGKKGTSTILLAIARDGTIVKAKVAKSGGPELDRYALFIARRIKWHPAKNHEGKDVDSYIFHLVRFIDN